MLSIVICTTYVYSANNVVLNVVEVSNKTTIYFSDDLSYTMSTQTYLDITNSGKSDYIFLKIKNQLEAIKKYEQEIELNRNNPNYDIIKMQSYIDNAIKQLEINYK